MTKRKKNWKGMNWISQHKRLAIYCRDGFACAWCGDSVELGAQLSLDHIRPDSLGGSNHERNLVTACSKCNSLRGNRTAKKFALDVAGYVQQDAEVILGHVVACSKRALDVVMAKKIVDRRGSCARALARLASGAKM